MVYICICYYYYRFLVLQWLDNNQAIFLFIMPYNTEILREKAIKAIKDNDLIFVEDICAYIGISKPCFYDHFKLNTDYFYELSSLLEENKIRLKTSIRKKWFDSDRDTGLMALYKLCSTPEEHKKLQQTYSENKNIEIKLGADLEESQATYD